MNRIYRLVWNRALRVMQVVSELAPAQRSGAGSEDARRVARPGLKPLAVALLLAAPWISESVYAACTPGNPSAGATVNCSGAANPLAPSYSASANNLTVNLQTGSSVGVLLGIGGTAMTLTGNNVTLNNGGTINPQLLGSASLLSSGTFVGNSAASTVTILNSTTGVMKGTSGLLGASLNGLTGMALAVQNGAGGVTNIRNDGNMAGAPLLGVTLAASDIPVVAAYGDGQVNFVNTGLIAGRVAFEAPPTPGIGNTFVNAGTINGSVSMGAASANTFTAVSGSSVNLAGGVGTSLPVTGLAGVTLSFAPTGVVDGGAGGVNTLELQNVLPSSGAGSGTGGPETTVSGDTYINFQHLRINSGTWDIQGPLVSLDTALNGGLANVFSADALGTGTTAANGGAIAAGAPGLTLTNNVVLGAGGLLTTGANDFEISGSLSGMGGLSKSGTGMLTLSGTNSYTGGTTVDAGVLEGNTDSLQGSIVDNASLVFNQTGNGTYAGDVSGSGSLTKNGVGTLTLTGQHTYAGGTAINDGILAIGAGGSLASAGGVSLAAGTTLDLAAAASQTIGLLSGTAGNVNLGSSTLMLSGAADATFGGVISGAGGLTMNGLGTQILSGANVYTGGTKVLGGTLAIGAGGSLAAGAPVMLLGGTFDLSAAGNQSVGHLDGTGGVVQLGGGGTLTLDSGSFAGSIAGNGGLVKTGTGTLSLDGSNSYAGTTQVQSGRLVIGSDAAHGTANVQSDITVASTGSLGGFGHVDGDVVVLNGGHLAPGAPTGAFTVNGNLTLAQGSQLDAQFGAPGPDFVTPGASHSTQVNGDLTLNGAVLDPADAGAYGPGLYNLFTYTGTLTMSGGGIVSPALSVITYLSGSKQINLINTQGIDLNIWNANGLATPTHMGGGSGTWSQASPNWTDATASFTSLRSPPDAFVIFGGAAGTVTVDDVGGTLPVTTQGIQFASDGYHLDGNALGLVAPSVGVPSELRVGDGSAASAGWTATIDNVLTGNGIEKAGAGTLILGGANTYVGTTQLTAGTLSVSSDANLGAVGNAIDFEGGTLQVTGTAYHGTSRAAVFGAAGGGIDIADAANTFTVTQPLAGTGALTKLGAGTLVLTGNNTYSGGTTVSAGVLEGDATSLQGKIANNASLVFNQAADGSFAGAISGTGTLTKDGAGTLSLDGANTYIGATRIDEGTLRLGANGSIASSSGVSLATGATLDLSGKGNASLTVLDGAGGTVDIGGNTLTLTGAGNGSYAGAIAGSGALVKAGAGTQTFMGATLYTGGTTVNDGTLVIGAGGSLAAGGRMSVNGNGVLDVAAAGDQSFATLDGNGGEVQIGSNTLTIAGGTYAGTIAGSGGLAKLGAGTLTLNGQNTYTGATTVAQGVLQLGDGSTSTAALGGNVTVQAAGSVAGQGTINGNLTNHGTLHPGALDAVGVLTVRGNFTQGSDGTLAVSLAPDGSGSQLIVNGAATLGGSALLLLPSAVWQPGTNYRILTAAGGIDGAFGSVTSNFAFITPTLTYGGTGVTLALARNTVAFPSVATTANGRAVAGATEVLGAGNPVFDAIVGLDGATAAAAFQQLQADIHASTRTALLANDRYVRDAINAHLSGTSSRASSQETVDNDGGSVWTSAWGHWGRHDSDGNASELSANGSGIVIGADTTIGSDARVGALVGHGQGSARSDVPNASARHVDTYAGLYADTRFNGFHLQGGAVYGWQKVTANRSITFADFRSSANARYDARTAQGYLDGSYEFGIGHSTLAPFVNIAYDRVEIDAIHEQGSVAAFDVKGDSTSVSFGTLGARGSFQLDDSGDIHANLSLGWQHTWGDVTPVASMRYIAGGPSFGIGGAPMARNSAAVSGGVSFKVAPAVTVDADYSGQFASDVKDQAARLGVTWVF